MSSGWTSLIITTFVGSPCSCIHCGRFWRDWTVCWTLLMLLWICRHQGESGLDGPPGLPGPTVSRHTDLMTKHLSVGADYQYVHAWYVFVAFSQGAAGFTGRVGAQGVNGSRVWHRTNCVIITNDKLISIQLVTVILSVTFTVKWNRPQMIEYVTFFSIFFTIPVMYFTICYIFVWVVYLEYYDSFQFFNP